MAKEMIGCALAACALAAGAGVARLPDAGAASGPRTFTGELRKQGPGTTSVARDDLCAVGAARLVVADGTLAVAAADGAPPPLPAPAALDAAALWLDAARPATILPADGVAGTVGMWLDARETGDGSAVNPYVRPRAVAFTNLAHSAAYAPDPEGWFPRYVPASGGACAYVDFGRYSSGRNVRFAAAAGSGFAVGGVRQAFAVLGTQDGGYGFVFNPGSHHAVFVPKSYKTLAEGTLPTAFLQPAGGWRTLASGLFRVDGRPVDPSVSGPNGGYQLLDITPGRDGWHVEGLFSYNAIANDNDGYRQGGGRLCEVILFASPLDESNRVAVAAYLQRKWGTRGAALSLATAGAGRVLKTGDGGWTLATLDGSESRETPRVALAGGSFDGAQPVAFEALAGTTLAASATGVVAAAEAPAGTVVKTGTGTLAVDALAPDVAHLAVREGTLRFAPRAFGASAFPTNLVGAIEDPSFEAFADAGIKPDTDRSLKPDAPTHGWRSVRLEGSTEDGKVTRWTDDPAAHYYYNVPGQRYPDGVYCGVLHIRGGLETVLTLPADGVYRLSFWIAQRPGYVGHETHILIDGEEVAQVQTREKAWQPCAFRLPWLAAGVHTLTLRSDANNSKAYRDATGGDSTVIPGNTVALVDDFRVDWLEAGTADVTLANPSFESAPFAFGRTYLENPASLGGWACETAGAADAVVVERIGNGRETALRPAEGCRHLVLHGAARIAQTVRVARAGTYRLSFAAASTAADARTTNTRAEIGVFWNGDSCGTVRTTDWTRRYAFTVQVAADNAAVELAFAGGGSLVALDDVRLEALDTAAVLDETFTQEGALADWTCVGEPSEIHDGAGLVEGQREDRIPGAWCDVDYDDRHCVGVRNRATLARTVTFPEAGTYRLSVAAINRFYRYNGRPEELNLFGGQEFRAWYARGGVTNEIGRFAPDTRERWVRHAFLFEVPEAGEGEIGFSGLKESVQKIAGSTRYFSCGGLLDGIVVEKVARAAAPTLPKDLDIDVDEGASLALDAPVTNEVRTVRYAGRFHAGVLDAATCPFITGPGALFARPRGTLLLVR